MAQNSIFNAACPTGQLAAQMVDCKQEGMRAQPLTFSVGPQRTVLAAKPVVFADAQRPSNRRTRR